VPAFVAGRRGLSAPAGGSSLARRFVELVDKPAVRHTSGQLGVWAAANVQEDNAEWPR
jgi:hypothetical protein